jgi:hypothetical protein
MGGPGDPFPKYYKTTMPKLTESQAADGLALLIGMPPPGGASKKPAPGNRCIVSVPAKALQVDGHLPSEGETVDLQVVATVRSVGKSGVTLELSTANGQPMTESAETEAAEGEPNAQDDADMMRAAEQADMGGLA